MRRVPHLRSRVTRLYRQPLCNHPCPLASDAPGKTELFSLNVQTKQKRRKKRNEKKKRDREESEGEDDETPPGAMMIAGLFLRKLLFGMEARERERE